MPIKLSIVTTIYNTADPLPEFYTRAVAAARDLGFEYELVLVNDASPDNGLAVAKALAAADANVAVIDLARNHGQHKAIWVGLEYCTGDLIAVLDGDLEDDPRWLPAFYARLIATGSDAAYGTRINAPGSALYRAGRSAFFSLLDAASGQRFPRNVTVARLMTRRYLDALLSFPEKEVFLLGLWHSTGFAQVAVPVEVSHRASTSYTARKLVATFVRGVTSFSTMPLYVVFAVGVVLSAFSALFILYLLYLKFVAGVGVEGWTSVMAAVMFLGGVTLFFNGIIAIYVATIFLEVKRRPTIVREVVNKRAMPAGSPGDEVLEEEPRRVASNR